MAAGLFRTFEVNIQQPNSGSLFAGGKWVRLATNANLNGAWTYANSTKKISGPINTVLADIDGVTPAVGDRFLFKDSDTGAHGDASDGRKAHGIYVINAMGSVSTAYELERDFDMSVSAEIKGAWMMVMEGTANGGAVIRNTNTGAVTMDTTLLTFAKGATEVVAGEGLKIDGTDSNKLHVELSASMPGLQFAGSGDTRTLESKNGDGIAVDANGIKADLETNGAGTGGLRLTAVDGTGKLAVDPSDGITLDTNGVAVNLETNGAGTGGLRLQGSAGSKTIGVDPSDGITLDTNGVAVNLEANGVNTGGLRLQGSAGSKTIGVDPSDGIKLDTNGVAISLDATDSGLEFTGTAGIGTLGIKAGADSSAGVNLTMLKRGSGAAANDGVIYSALIGNGTLTAIPVTHGLGKQFCLAQVYDAASPYAITDCNVKMDSTTACTVEFTTAPATDSRRLVLMAVA